MKREAIISLIMTVAMVGGLWAWTYTYDTDVPLGSAAPSVIDDQLRVIKDGVQERENIDHYWPLTGTEVSDSDAGKHRQVTFQVQIASPTVAADQGVLYTKDYDGGSGAATELYWEGEGDMALQLTELNTAGNAAALFIDGTYENEVNFSSTANTFMGDVIGCTSGGYLTLPIDSTNTTEGNLRYDDTGDTVSVRTASAWAKLAPVIGYCQIATGSYSGDGEATQAITGVGFQSDVVIIIPEDDDQSICVATSDMDAGYAKLTQDSATSHVDDSITAIGAIGFTVGDGTDSANAKDDMNDSGSSNYHYICLKVGT